MPPLCIEHLNSRVFPLPIIIPLAPQPHLHETGEDWYNAAPRKLVDKAINAQLQRPEQQVVILSQVLVDEVNSGYQGFADLEVLKVDGKRPNNLRHLRWLVEHCEGQFVRFDLDDGRVVVLDREEAEVAHRRILELHRVPAPMSADLLADFEPPTDGDEKEEGKDDGAAASGSGSGSGGRGGDASSAGRDAASGQAAAEGGPWPVGAGIGGDWHRASAPKGGCRGGPQATAGPSSSSLPPAGCWEEERGPGSFSAAAHRSNDGKRRGTPALLG